MWIVKEEGLLNRMPELKSDQTIYWQEEGTGQNFMSLCSLLKRNAIPAKKLYLGCN